MTDTTNLIEQLQASLDQAATQKTRDWWGNYLRHVISFRGVGIPEIRDQIASWRTMNEIDLWDSHDQLDLALQLFDFPQAEDKLAGILYLQVYLYDQFPWQELLPKYERLFQRGLIFDWNTCDWFCVRVLGPTILHNGMACAEAVSDWRTAHNLWQARSSIVAFVPVSGENKYDELIYQSSQVLIRRDERFAKTAVGWVLRDISRRDPQAVLRFVDDHLPHFSLESLKNALKYYESDLRKQYQERLKTVRSRPTK